jgi:hypothetical protein
MTFKGLIKTIIALVIIGAAVAIGWAVATATNPYNTSAATAAPAAAQSNQGQGAARPTAIPTFTPSTNTGTGASTTPGASGQAQGNTGTGGGTGQGFQRAAPVTGTVTTYDTGNKILTVKDVTGKDQQFDASNARVTKTEKLASADFSSALGNNAIVLLTGEKGSDGTYTATSLMVVDTTAFGGGTGGFGGGRAGTNGTPGANGAGGTPAAGGSGAGAGTGTGRGNAGGFGGGAGFGGANGGVIIRQATLQGNKLTGTDATGQAITATVSDSTVLEKQAAGTADDLKAGANVSIVSRPATADAPPQAITITLS